MNRYAALALLALLTFQPLASAQGWRDTQGKPHADTGSAKSKDGFSAMIMMTPDRDWEEKWNTPPEVAPRFTTADEVPPGGELLILTFLANPKVDASGMTDVACDLRIKQPDGKVTVDERDVPCFKVKLTTSPESVFLSSAAVKFVSEPTDPRGTWTVEVRVKDRLRGVEIPLRSTFLVL